METELYAAIYLDDGRDAASVAETVAGIVGGLAAGATVVTETAEIFVLEREDFPGEAGDLGRYRYCLEIEPLENVDAAAFRGMAAALLAELREAGFRAAAVRDEA
jgi:hypothetical protein